MPTTISVFGVRLPDKALERKRVLSGSLLLLGSLAFVEWHYRLDVSLGIFYTIPVMIAGLVLNRTEAVLLAFGAAFVRGMFTPANSDLEFFLKFLMASIAYVGAGLVVVEMSNNRRRLLEHYARLKLEQERRMRAEAQLRTLAESSPAGILTLDGDMVVLAANLAAHEMLALGSGELVGRRVDQLFPLFDSALKISPGIRPIRTAVTGWAQRANGQKFPVQAWFSIYGEENGKRLAAIVVDVSEELRDREWDNFQHLLDYNRLLAGAVSHEIRNMCSAISVVCSNLRETAHSLHDNADFDALQRLVFGLSRLASFELTQEAKGAAKAELKSVLDQLRVVIDPDWTEIDGVVRYEVHEPWPVVQGDSYGLLQIFLNLCQNSCRAVAGCAIRELRISSSIENGEVTISFIDSGPGLSNSEALFHPFRPGADGSGLGLYISRELARSFGGDLVYVPTPDGCRFDVVLSLAQSSKQISELEHASI